MQIPNRKKRIASLYDKDQEVSIRNSHDNPRIQTLYQDFYHKPLSDIAEALLHTSYHICEDLHEDPAQYTSQCQEDKTVSTATSSTLAYKCSVCGYIYEGDITKEGDAYTCPICTVPKEMFEKIENNIVEDTVPISSISYKCTICGYIYEGDITKESDAYTCPICTVPKEMFEKDV